MLNIIATNPYRVLGVYSNSPKKDQVANKGRISAFLRVNRPAVLPLDLNGILPDLSRTSESVNLAESQLTLVNEQIKYAQFWFIKITPLDDIAFNHLQSGNVDAAFEMWEKTNNMSSLQNRFVCCLIQGNLSKAINVYAKKLYVDYGQNFIQTIAGANATETTENLIHTVVDVLSSEKEVSLLSLYGLLTDPLWRRLFKDKLVTPLISALEESVNVAKQSRGQGILARYNAGNTLMNDTKTNLQQLKDMLGADNMQYQMIADKVGLEILQCGIDYFNKSEALDAPYKAMKLQKYAQTIVAGSMAKDRCNDNVKILQEIIDDLPPQEIASDVKAINDELKKYCSLPDKILYAIDLLNHTKPYLQNIKNKLGSYNTYYLKLSTRIVDNALHNIIEEVNQSQQLLKANGLTMPYSIIASISTVKGTMDSAWRAIQIMDCFDMESSFKSNRYNPNRSTLSNLRTQVQQLENSINSALSRNRSSYSGSSYSSSSSPSSSSSSGCMVWLILAVAAAIVVSCSCI